MKNVLKFLVVLAIFSTTLFSNVSSDPSKVYPAVIIGGGVGGLSSGIYLSRAGITPLIVEGKASSLITQSNQVENWPGEESIDGIQLLEKIKNQAQRNGCLFTAQEAIGVDFSKHPYEITLKNIYDDKIEKIYAHSCIIATGSHPNKLNIPGEEDYFGKGVSACALCDGSFYKNKIVAVIGGSDAALVEAMYLSNLANKVYVIVRKDDFRSTCDQKKKDLLLQKANVEILYNSVLTSIQGDSNKIEKIELQSTLDKALSFLNVDGVFLAIGSTPNTGFLKDQVKLDENGYIIVKEGGETSKKGIYAVGDVVKSESKQAIIAASSGAIAAIEDQKYLSQNSIGPYASESKGILSPSKSIGYSPKKPPIKPLDSDQSMEVDKSLTKKLNEKPSKEILDMVVEVTSKEHFESLLKDSSIPVLVDFYAKWCGPCKRIAPYLSEKAKSLEGVVRILKVDVDLLPTLAKKYNVNSMPTLLVFDQKANSVSRKVGSDEILKLINAIDKIKDHPENELSDLILNQN